MENVEALKDCQVPALAFNALEKINDSLGVAR